jgi:Putative DNA-binding domain
MNLLEQFNSIKIQNILSFIEEAVEEDLFLEFKTVNHPTIKNDGSDKKNLSKCLSGFANSLGGIIVWGVKASLNEKGIDAAKELKPIDEVSKLSNWFKKLEGQAVTPSILGVRHKKIITGEDTGYLVTYVPPSDDCPHMANYAEKHYYKRSGDNFYPCEHYDIVDLFNRKKFPKLEVKIDEIKCHYSGSVGGNPHYEISTNVFITNSGKTMAKYPRLSLTVNRPYRVADWGIDGNGGRGLKLFPTTLYSKGYYGGIDVVIHQGSEIQVDKIELKNIYDDSAIKDLKITYEVEAEDSLKIIGEIKIEKTEILSIFNEVKSGNV